MYKITTLLSFIFLFAFSAKSTEIAAIEHDGRYMVFDLNTFEISNVGDLSRFGFIYVNHAIPGSTYDSAVIVAEFFKEPSPTDKSFNHSQLTLNKLTKLNHDRSYIPKGNTINYNEQYIRWVANDSKQRIIAMSRTDKKTTTIYDKNLTQIKQHKFDKDHKIHNAAACTNENGDIVMAGLTKTITYADINKQTIVKDLLINKELENY